MAEPEDMTSALNKPETGTTPREARVLLVDDDRELCQMLSEYLSAEHFEVKSVHDGGDALAELEANDFEILILDVMLPSVSGFDVLRTLGATHDTPILMLTARGDDVDRIVGLELGADDYLTKPFSPRELAIRVRNLMRRTVPSIHAATPRIAFGDVVIDPVAREVRKGGELLRLTLKELDLLLFFASNPRQVFSRDQLMDRVWDYRSALDTGTVTVHVRRLRQKIEDDASRPRHLETVFGSGYRFTP